jgi:hypothetical protein
LIYIDAVQPAVTKTKKIRNIAAGRANSWRPDSASTTHEKVLIFPKDRMIIRYCRSVYERPRPLLACFDPPSTDRLQGRIPA